jgi:SAM-dependent methyltransferase
MSSPSSNALNLTTLYDKAFYAAQISGSARSASATVPRILELFPWVSSVVDVGCGTGTWLHQFHLLGVSRVLGLDGGDATADLMQIDKPDFLRKDLGYPFDINEKFDLAMSLEVAEHLPAEFAINFVSNLVHLSDVIVFGAAIPGQGGTNHVNERWPSYWAALFEKHGFLCFDVLRGDMWYDERVEWWYRQNTFVFVNKQRTDLVTKLEVIAATHRPPIDLVHPVCFDVYRGTADLIERGRVDEAAMPPAERTELAILRERVYAIERSTSWRVISTIQRLIAPYPGLRKSIRRGVTAVRLMVAGKFFSTLRERRRAAAGKH